MYSKIFSSRLCRRIFVTAATVALIALAACGGDDATAAEPSPTQAPLPTPTAPTAAVVAATPMPEPPAAPMTPATAPEPGSDEEQIMAVLEKQVIAVNTADYESFQETCTPSAKKLPTMAQLKLIYEENSGATGSTYLRFFSAGIQRQERGSEAATGAVRAGHLPCLRL